MGSEKSAPLCPFDREGAGGLKIFGQCPWKQHISNRGFPIMQYSETKTENQGLASSFRNIIYRNLYFIVKVQIVLIQGQSHLDEQTGICAFTNDL